MGGNAGAAGLSKPARNSRCQLKYILALMAFCYASIDNEITSMQASLARRRLKSVGQFRHSLRLAVLEYPAVLVKLNQQAVNPFDLLEDRLDLVTFAQDLKYAFPKVVSSKNMMWNLRFFWFFQN